jgi:NAD(P)-dependent dehydrogenase (short-subunit alcohol dehydrogenase family)
VPAKGFERFDLTGKSCFVTGGSMGIGYNIALSLLKSGARVMIAARREAKLTEAVERLRNDWPGAEVDYVTLDLTDPNSVAKAADHAIRKYDGVDVFVGNAAIQLQEYLEDIQQDSCDKMFQANVTANIMLTKAFTEKMRQNRWGRIIFSSSVMANHASPNERVTTYTTAKGAIDSFTLAAAAEVGRDNVTVNSINLGVFITEMSDDVLASSKVEEQPREVGKMYASMTCSGRFGKTEDVEGMIQLLASDAGSYINGANLALDGGLARLVRPFPLQPLKK